MTFSRKFSIAPMMDWTDTHCRVLHRLLSARALLYTEMVTAEAILHGDKRRLLGFDASEHPVALQLGGSDPGKLAEAARIAQHFGYDEVNLNVGCPSDRVQSGRFGACLMQEPALVADCVAAMRAAVSLPVTVKCRIGVDGQDPELALRQLIGRCADAGVTSFAVHARKAWLEGLSPKENRDVPPLDYDLVHRVKLENPGLEIILNGGVQTLEDAETHLARFDGVMLGRAAYQNSAMLAEVDARFFGAAPGDLDRAVDGYCDYVERKLAEGVRLNSMTKHMLGLFNGRPGARAFRHHLSENATRDNAGISVLRDALAMVRPQRPRRLPERHCAARNRDGRRPCSPACWNCAESDQHPHRQRHQARSPAKPRQRGDKSPSWFGSSGGFHGLRSSGRIRPLRDAWRGVCLYRRTWRAYWLQRPGFPPPPPATACWTRPAPGPRCRLPASRARH